MRWLKFATPALCKSVGTFPSGAVPTKKQLRTALRRSEDLVARFIGVWDAGGKVTQWKGPPATFLGYLVAHEAHHRGLAMVAMRVSGRKLSDRVVYGQWQWGKKRATRS
jgi:uncharacterized damage-inducible protein DinB